MQIKYEEELWFFLISRGVPECIYAKYLIQHLIMLERTIYLAIILLLLQNRSQNHWSDGKHNAKVRTVN